VSEPGDKEGLVVYCCDLLPYTLIADSNLPAAVLDTQRLEICKVIMSNRIKNNNSAVS